MFVVSFIGLLGDATEEFVENLDTQKGKSTLLCSAGFRLLLCSLSKVAAGIK